MEISPDGKYVFNKNGVIYSLGVRKEDDLIYYGKIEGYSQIVFSEDKRMFATVGDTGIIRIYNYDDLSVVQTTFSFGNSVGLFMEGDILQCISVFEGSHYLEVFNLNAFEEYKAIEKSPYDMIVNDLISPDDHLFDNKVNDIIFDHENNAVYMSDKENKNVIRYDYTTMTKTSVSFDYMPESMYLVQDNLYVSLLVEEHDSYDGKDTGFIAVVDHHDMSIRETFPITIDPYDILVDQSQEFIYVMGGSNQHTKIKSFSLISQQEVGVSSGIYNKANIKFGSDEKRIYAVTNNLSPTDYHAFNIENGQFVGQGTNSPYHGHYSMNGIYMSPDGMYIFSKSGEIFTASREVDDMVYHGKIPKYFYDISFDLENNRFFVGIESGLIYEYDYTTLEGINSYSLPSQGKYISYQEGKLYAMCPITDVDRIENYTFEMFIIDID